MARKLGGITLVAMLAVLAPAGAKAQGRPEARGGDLLTTYGEYFLAGGGVAHYFSGAVRDAVDTGGAWDLRLGFGSRTFVGAELAYAGSARKAGRLGTNLFTNGAEAALRLQYPYALGTWLVEPFAFGGAGWTHFSLSSPTGVALRNTDDVFTVPVGGGVMLAYGRVLLDARFTYRQTFDENLIRDYDGSAAKLSSWAVTASVGYEF